MSGACAEGFSTYGILHGHSSGSSSIYNDFQDCFGYQSGLGLYLWSHNSTKSVNGNQFTNCRFLKSTGSANVRMTGPTNENVFSALDISHGPTITPTTIGMQLDANSGRDTWLQGVTAEGLGTIFSLGANVVNFVARGVDGGAFNGASVTPIVADPSATYDISWGVLGNSATERDQSPTNVNRLGYVETAGLQEPSGQAGVGLLQNLVTNSEALTNAAWVKVNPAAQTITDNAANAACAPQCGTNTASKI